MRRVLVAAVLLAAVFGAAPAARADVDLSIRDGQVTLVATAATVSEILEAWARVGQTRVVNGDRIPGAPVTLQLTDVPEAEALDIVLRAAAGYLAAPRAAGAAGASRFDRIIVMPTSNPPRNVAAPQPAQPPPFMPPMPTDPFDDQDQDDPGGAVPSPRGPVFNGVPADGAMPTPVFGGQAFPGAVPQPAPQPQNRFGMPAGVAVPGMVMPAPQPQTPPGQPPFFPVPVPQPDQR